MPAKLMRAHPSPLRMRHAPLPPSPLPPPLTVGERDFLAYQRFIYEEAGIYLSSAKRALLAGRLARRMRELQFDSFGAYLALARADEAERTRMLDAVTTNETHFFREPRHFAFLEREVLPAWRARGRACSGRRVRVWSAGCSSGEEPYSLAMVLLHHLRPEEGWEVEVLGTDLSTRVLERARAALYPVARAGTIPPHYLRAFMLEGSGSREGVMKAGPALRAAVRFEQANLNDAQLAVAGPFDLVFCRNVLIYFDAASKARAVDRLLDRLAPGGHFFLGHAESLNGVTRRARPLQPTIYVAGPQER